jgi:hypothetical protein
MVREFIETDLDQRLACERAAYGGSSHPNHSDEPHRVMIRTIARTSTLVQGQLSLLPWLVPSKSTVRLHRRTFALRCSLTELRHCLRFVDSTLKIGLWLIQRNRMATSVSMSVRDLRYDDQ